MMGLRPSPLAGDCLFRRRRLRIKRTARIVDTTSAPAIAIPAMAPEDSPNDVGLGTLAAELVLVDVDVDVADVRPVAIGVFAPSKNNWSCPTAA